MSTFWMIYFICLGITIFFVLLTLGLFELEYEGNIPIPYAILAICVCAIPGLGMLGTLILIIAIVGGVINGDIVPKKFENEKND